MNRYLIIIIWICCLTPSLILAEQTVKDIDGQQANTDDALVEDFLSNPKNPFLSLMPKEGILITRNTVKEDIIVERPLEKTTPAPVSVAEIKSNLKIKGIVWGGDRPQAIINDQIVNIGDKIQDTKVVAITEDGVDVEYKGKKISLTEDE